MRGKKLDTFNFSNTSDTAAPNSNYDYQGTQISRDTTEMYAHKTELTSVRELMMYYKETIESQIKDIKEMITNRETRFWIVNGIIIAAIIAIFLAVLPELYNKDNKDKFDDMKSTINNINNKIDTISKKINK